jgi:hypothetical protein
MLAFLDDMEDPGVADAALVEGAYFDGRPQGHMEPERANRRLTFRIDTADREIYDVNLEDYH